MQVKPEYEEITEFNDIAIQLINKFPEVFPNVDAEDFMSKIKCVGITNKERKDEGERAKIEGITMPKRMFSEAAYVITLYSQDWNEMAKKHKASLVMNMLRRIPLDAESEGKVNPLDFKDDGMLVRTLGADYMDRDDIPDLLDEDVKWVIR